MSSDEPQALRIWLLLVDSNGAPYKCTGATKVLVPSSADVSDFRDAVKAKYADSHLKGVASSDLIVYKNRAEFNKQNPLEEDFPIEDFGKFRNEALIAFVPSSVCPLMAAQNAANTERRIF
jgi:hypothetical protein